MLSNCNHSSPFIARRRHMENGRIMERLTYFLMGSAVAAGVAFLVTPKSGKENREILASKAREGKEFLDDKIRQGKKYMERGKERVTEQGQEIAHRAKEIAQEQADHIRGAVEQG
jgi:gas vesicle protein